jgi:hypothetical protein
MHMHSLLLAALPQAGLNMTTDFAPLFVGLVVGLCLWVLVFAFALGVYDTCWPPRQGKPSQAPPAVSELPDAA